MLVSEWMTRDLVTLAPSDTLAAAAELMARKRVRRIPLVAAERLVGIVTKGDLLAASPPEVNPFAAEVAPAPALGRRLETIMTRRPLTVAGTTPLEEAAQIMIEKKVGGLPVLTGEALVGILTESDLFRAFAAAMGAHEPGLRITFEVGAGEQVVPFVVALAQKHGMRVASVLTLTREASNTAVVRLLGREPPALLEELWRTGHRVQSVLRMTGGQRPA